MHFIALAVLIRRRKRSLLIVNHMSEIVINTNDTDSAKSDERNAPQEAM